MKLPAHCVLLAVVAAAIGACFLQEPLLGDDLTYWSFAFGVHEHGLGAWQQESFYQLRWPVWGVCWLLQGIFGPGLPSYWGVSLLYLAAGTALAFSFARQLTRSIAAAWACGLAFVFHPFLDAGLYCPMPDLSEAVWQAAAMLAWWKLMHATNAVRAWGFASLTGFLVFVTEANRITGVFIVPVLIVCTALFFRRRFGWLIAAGLIALVFYAAQSAFYHHLFGDWLHDLTANTLNRNARGTEFSNAWMLPFRFLDTFWHDPLARTYSLLALGGTWFACRPGNVLGRVIAIWFVGLLLEYSCAPQSLSPIRPLVRDAARFLSCLALPMSLLATLCLWRIAQSLLRLRVIPLLRQPWTPIFVGLLAIGTLTAGTKRNFFDPGFVPELRHYLATVPDGTSIFTHREMRAIVELVDPAAAERFRWVTGGDILKRDPQLEADAARCDEFWYARKLTWLPTRQEFARNREGRRPVLASYLATPEREWNLVESIIKGGSPELVFYRRRSHAPSPESLEPEALNAAGILPTLPAVWERGRSIPRPKLIWPIPEQFRGRLVRLEFAAASDQTEPVTVRLRYHYGNQREKKPFVLLPYLLAEGGTDFFTLRIPATSIKCEIELRFTEQTRRVELTRFRAVLENATQP